MGVKQNFHVLSLIGKMRVNGENWQCVCLMKGLMLRQLKREARKPFFHTLAIAVLDRNVLSFNIAG